MEKIAFAVIVVLWLVWLAAAGKLDDFLALAIGKSAQTSRSRPFLQGSVMQ